MKTIRIWNIQFHPLRKTQIVSLVEGWLESGRRGIHLTGVNPEQVAKAAENPLLRQAINDSDIVNIDGFLIVQTLRLCGCRVPERAATPDVFEMLMSEADRRGQSVYFLGAEPSVLDKMLRNIAAKYPRVRIAGAHHGFYTPDQEPGIVGRIAAAAPDFLFLGLPSPQKETFILKYKRQLPVGCFYGIGGAFDVAGGKVARAPRWAQKAGLEWFCRIAQNPGNYGVRVCRYYFPFIGLFFRELFERKRCCS